MKTPTKEIVELANVLDSSTREWVKRDTEPELYPDNPTNHYLFVAERVLLYFERKDDRR